MRELATGHTVACHFPLVEPVSPVGAAGQVNTARTTVRSEEIEETPR